MSDEYQGYKNRETWALLLWIGNDQGLYYQAVEWGKAYTALGESDRGLGETYLEQLEGDWTEYEEEGNTTAEFRSMRREIGSWWRIDATEVGAWLREAASNES